MQPVIFRKGVQNDEGDVRLLAWLVVWMSRVLAIRGVHRARQRAIQKTRRANTNMATASTQQTTGSSQFETLRTQLRELKALESVGGVLDWDQMVMMAGGSDLPAQLRSLQSSALAAAVHSKATDGSLGDAISQCEAEPVYHSLTPAQQVCAFFKRLLMNERVTSSRVNCDITQRYA